MTASMFEREEEQHDPESLANRLRDFERDKKEDQRLQGANAQSTPYQVDNRTFLCNATQTTNCSNGGQKERLNVAWVQRL